MDCVGIVRTTKRLDRVRLLARETEDYYGHFRVAPDLIELRNLVVAELIVRSALARKESRRMIDTQDFPDALPEAADTVLAP